MNAKKIRNENIILIIWLLFKKKLVYRKQMTEIYVIKENTRPAKKIADILVNED